MTNEPLLAELVDRADVVFHLAAAVGVKLIVEEPVHTIETNVHGTEVVLQHANKKKKLVVHRLDLRGLRQEHRRAVPRGRGPGARPDARSTAGPTRAARRIDEFLALALLEGDASCRSSSCGFFNTVGPRQTGQYGMVLPTFVRQALAGEPITVFGDGTQSRSFTYVGDVVGALLKLMVRAAARSARCSTSATSRK